MVGRMRILLVALAVALIASGEAHAQITTQPTGPGAGFCAPRTLSYGAAPEQATIAAAGGVGCYRFDGVAGDKVRIRLIPTGGSLDPAVTTGRPGGGVSCATTTQNDSTCVLDATGVHSITVADAAGTKTGHYAISLQRLNDPVACGPALSFSGNAVADSLTAAGDSECHRFSATAGDRVRVNLLATTTGLNPAVEVVRPDGSSLCGITGTPLTCTAPVTGTYTLLVRDPLPGGYGVSLQRLQSPVGCTTLLTGYGPHTRALPAAGEMRCFRVHEDAGAKLRVRVIPTSGTLIPTAEVLRPDGTTRCAATAADDSTCNLDTGGHHTILVRDGGPSGTGAFTISLQRLDAPVNCAAHQLGTLPATNLLYPGDVECHQYEAVAGDRVRVRLHAQGATPILRPRFEVIQPGGWLSCASHEELTCTTPVTGTYTVLVTDQSPGNRTGGYELSVQRLNDPAGCAPASFGPDAQEADLEDGETDCMRVFGESGDRIRFRSVAVHGMDLVAEVIRPDGTTRCSRAAATGLTCQLDTTGTHIEIVRADGRTLGGTTGTGTVFDSGWRLDDTGTHTVLLRDDDRGYDTGQYAIELRR